MKIFQKYFENISKMSNFSKTCFQHAFHLFLFSGFSCIMRKSRDYDRKMKLEREEKEAKEAERQALETERQAHRIEAIYALEAKLAQKRET